MEQLPQLIGAALLLIAYGLLQTGRIQSDGVLFNVLNLVGSVLLLFDAIRALQWGFILLEGAWALLTVPTLWKALRA